MKVLVYSGMLVALTANLCASDMLGDARLMRILAGLDKANQTSSESFSVDNPLGHAEVQPSVGGASSILVGDDSGGASEENILDDATPGSSVLNELGRQESLGDQQYGVLSGTGPNEDESTRYKAELDSKLAKAIPEVKVLDKANPNSAASAA